MAIIANTFQSTSATANRESLHDAISMITPRDTPIFSLMEKGTAQATYEEWVIRNLRAAAANAQLEGDEYAFNASTPSVRVGNRTQIIRESWIVSRSQNSVRNAGEGESSKRLKLEAGMALRKDIELGIVSNNASVAGATRVFGGLPSWITTNASRGATGANGGFNNGTKLTVAATNGTQRTFTQTLLDDLMQSVYVAGGEVTDLVGSAYIKRVFVGFMSNPNVAVFRRSVEDGKSNRIVSNADYYDGPYGTVRFMPNRVMNTALTSRNVFALDMSLLRFLWLDEIANDPDVAKTGDAKKGVLIGEGTLEVSNEQGLGVVADVFGLTAST